MKILIIGSGGREHALAWKISHSPQVTQVLVAPGNAGTEQEPGVNNIPIAAEDVVTLANFAKTRSIDLTIVGPEVPLCNGIVDIFQNQGLKCLGPSRAAAQLEASKVFAKEFLKRHHIPTANYATFTNAIAALEYLRHVPLPIVIKFDGLAAGKGVVVAYDLSTAENAVNAMLLSHNFATAGQRIVIEEFLPGDEVSFIALVDGNNVVPLASSQDHKTLNDGDTGPNTGGMGAYSPAPVLTPELHEKVMQEIITPTIRGMAAEGRPYTGFLYAGLMLTPDGTPKVLEFNCRLGDPETQPMMLRLKSDLADLCLAAVENRLDQVNIEWDAQTALGVVLTSAGYPGPYSKGHVITGLPATPLSAAKIFHAGTVMRDGYTVTNGGRVLCVTALGTTMATAQQHAYELVKNIQWPGCHYRCDIGYRALTQSHSTPNIGN